MTLADRALSDCAAVIHGRKLRLVIITEDDPVYVSQFFEVFFADYPQDDIEIVAVSIQDAFMEPLTKTASRVYRFYGPIDFVRLTGRYLVRKLTGKTITNLAVRKGLPLLACQSVNEAKYIECLSALEPDIILSIAAPEIFGAAVLALPKLGCINVHSGRLPKYRGMMPNFWQMLHGEQHSVVTVHDMVEELDAGRVLATQEWPIRHKDSLDRVIIGSKRAAAGLVIETILRLKQGNCERVAVDLSAKEYFGFPKPGDVAAFRERGHRLM